MSARDRATTLARAGLWRVAGLALVWWAVSEGSTVVGPYYAVPVVLVATAVSLWASPPRRRRRRRPLAVAGFAAWFLMESVRGGLDVTARALRPRMRLDPGVVEHPLRLREDPSAAVLLADVVSLLPGTLAVVVHEDRLTLHVLDRGSDVLTGIAEAERRLAAALGLDLVEG